MESSIDHANIQNIGTNSHDSIDNHIEDASMHFTQSGIDHTVIQNVGTNTHSDIDNHIANSGVHHAAVSAAGAPLTLSGQQITFNYDITDFSLSSDDLYILDSGIHHGGITGLLDDDHTQYALLAGRANQLLTLSGIYFEDTNTSIMLTSGELTFTDQVAGTVTLNELRTMKNIWISVDTQSEGNLTLADATNWATQYSYISRIKVVTFSTNWDMWLCETSDFDAGLITTRQIATQRNGSFDIEVACEYNSDSNNVYLTYTDNSGSNTADILVVGEARRH
jgi:hypothetical protein